MSPSESSIWRPASSRSWRERRPSKAFMSKTRILIIEDESAIAEGIAYNLRREGYDVTRAADGETGLAEARRSRPNLVLLDLMLPGLGGIEVCQAVRREGGLPVLMLPARATDTDKVVGLAVGADDYVPQ